MARNATNGWVKLFRSLETKELLRSPLAFALLGHISTRARWRNTHNNTDDLALGEALIGDYENYGMSRREYRTSVERLEKWGFITARRTPKGTIARLISTTVFDINEQPSRGLASEQNAKRGRQNDQHNFIGENRPKRPTKRPTKRPSNGHQTTNKRPLTNNEIMKEQKNDDTRTRERANATKSQPVPESSSRLSVEEAEKDPRWPQFVRYCRNQPGGGPTLKGFSTWLKSQVPRKIRPAAQRKAAAEPLGPRISDTKRKAALERFKADNENAGLRRARFNTNCMKV